MNPVSNTNLSQSSINNPVSHSRLYYFGKGAQTILLTPFTTTAKLACRLVKLITWDLSKAAGYKIAGYHSESSAFLENQYLKTVRVARDLIFIPSVATSAFKDMVAKREQVKDDLPSSTEYLSVQATQKFEQLSSYMHGCKTFNVLKPIGIKEFAAESDGSLNTVMASHFLEPGVMAINFGIPNVATFLTEEKADKSVQTVKVDAKSLKREKMAFRPSNGKIQSGIFFVPTNLPNEALERYRASAQKHVGRADITCVNTNARVLKDAGFSIEGKEMEEIVFPTTFMEHLLYRKVFYTDLMGYKHQVHFDIINTTPNTLEEHHEKIDTAVVGTRSRHRRRHGDTEENKKVRGEFAKALIAEEKKRLKKPTAHDTSDLNRRKITVSVPSMLGDLITRAWGRHTMYEVDLADKKTEIAKAFEGEAKLRPFPQAKPSFATRLKRDIFFSGPMIRFLRRHMMGDVDTIHLNTEDLFNHLKSTNGERLNYVILDDKVVLAKIKPNGNSKQTIRKAADWALTKHALAADRQEVYCSGEIWFDKDKQRFMMNKDSGTYMPNDKQVTAAVKLANEIFKTANNSNVFEVAEAIA